MSNSNVPPKVEDSNIVPPKPLISTEAEAIAEAKQRFKDLGFDKILTEPPLQPGNQLSARTGLGMLMEAQSKLDAENTCGPKVTPSGVPLNADEDLANSYAEVVAMAQGTIVYPNNPSEPASAFDFHEQAQLEPEPDSEWPAPAQTTMSFYFNAGQTAQDIQNFLHSFTWDECRFLVRMQAQININVKTFGGNS